MQKEKKSKTTSKTNKAFSCENKTHRYKTKQRDLVLDYFISRKDKHITAEDIINYFKSSNIKVSKSTVYRSLDILVKEGLLTKYMIDEKSSCCYSYVSEKCDMHNHYHLRCNDCDEIFHVDGKELTRITSKIKKEFDFDIDITKTVLYGKCKKCSDKNKKSNKKK